MIIELTDTDVLAATLGAMACIASILAIARAPATHAEPPCSEAVFGWRPPKGDPCGCKGDDRAASETI